MYYCYVFFQYVFSCALVLWPSFIYRMPWFLCFGVGSIGILGPLMWSSLVFFLLSYSLDLSLPYHEVRNFHLYILIFFLQTYVHYPPKEWTFLLSFYPTQGRPCLSSPYVTLVSSTPFPLMFDSFWQFPMCIQKPYVQWWMWGVLSFPQWHVQDPLQQLLYVEDVNEVIKPFSP